jgi:modulator of FtsH protease
MLLAILIISILLLMPAARLWANGVEIFVTGLTLWGIVSFLDKKIYQDTEKEFKKMYLSHLVINQVATLPYLAGSILLMVNNGGGFYFVTAGIIACFIKSLLDAWVLLVEINR